MAAERLQKYLARAGVASRRHAEVLITEGHVAVNNKKVTELGSKVEPGDLVTVDGELVTPPEKSTYFLLYKPVGVVTTLSDPQGRPTVASYIEETGKRLFPVGRLDYDAEGALLVTDDGELAHKLTHPSFQVPRTYLAKVKGVPDEATLDKLRGGVRLEDGMATPLSVDVFEAVERNTWLKLVVAEGRPHLIKRLCAAVGYPVVRLYRPAYAGIGVEGLRPGQMRPLTAGEVNYLQEVAEGRTKPTEKALKLPPRRHGRSAPGFEVEGEDEDFGEEAPAPVRARKTAKPARSAARAERPARAAAGPPERKTFGPRGEGGARPAFSRGAGARPARKAFEPRDEEGTERAARPARKEFAPRGAARPERGARPERREWAPRGEERAERTARPARKEWAPRGEGAERTARPARKEWAPRGEGAERTARPARKAFAPRGEERAERTARPARKEFAPRGEGAERTARPARKEWAPRGEGAERTARPARKEFAPRGEGRPERGAARPARKEWAPRGEGAERTARPARKEWAPRGEGRPERGARPERREWAPRGEERTERTARPARKEFAPRGEGRPERGAARPARKEFAPRGEGRPVSRGPARPKTGETGEGSSSFVDWRSKKKAPSAGWNARPPRGGAGGPRGRGPRKDS